MTLVLGMWCDCSDSLVLVLAFSGVLAGVNNQMLTHRCYRRISPPTNPYPFSRRFR